LTFSWTSTTRPTFFSVKFVTSDTFRYPIGTLCIWIQVVKYFRSIVSGRTNRSYGSIKQQRDEIAHCLSTVSNLVKTCTVPLIFYTDGHERVEDNITPRTSDAKPKRKIQLNRSQMSWTW
jgi:hypothetical protein